MAAQAGLCLAWSETPEDTFRRVVAQFRSIVKYLKPLNTIYINYLLLVLSGSRIINVLLNSHETVLKMFHEYSRNVEEYFEICFNN